MPICVVSFCSDVFKEKVKSGPRELDDKKKQLEQSPTAKAQEAKERLTKQATERHENFTAMSSNAMNQHKENIHNLLTNKMQESHSAADKWKETHERAVKLVHDGQGKLFEKKCQETRKQENDESMTFQMNQERRLKTKANEIEAKSLTQAQSLLDQPPMDMGEAKEELETQLRERGDQVREGVESAQNEKHLQQTGESLMKETRRKLTSHACGMDGDASINSATMVRQLPTSPPSRAWILDLLMHQGSMPRMSSSGSTLPQQAGLQCCQGT
jgi:hypothetical protein